MRVRIKTDLKLLATGIALTGGKIYDAVIAENLPNFKEEGKIFITNAEGDTSEIGFMLTRDDYNIIEQIRFKGIDSWNRAVFRGILLKRNFFGCTSPLFDYYAEEDEVLKTISEKNLCFFGNSMDCEPEGTPSPNIEIVRS